MHPRMSRVWLAAALLAASALPADEGGPRRTEWPFTALEPVRVPGAVDPRDCRGPIDAFVGARLDEAGLEAAPPASRRELIRRVTLDLLGLPPTPGEIEAFVADPAPDAWERLLDRLLASPRHGERRGRHWLDVARYTESQGFEYDRLRDRAWHYRDYVIESFNADTPYDRFIAEQIAGDVIEPVTRDGIVATSLLVCGPWDQAGNGQANKTQRMITREEELEDLVSVVCQTFLGVTVNCARCHEHKYDPIPQVDYYRVKAVFEGVVHGERDIVPPAEVRAREERARRLEAEIAAIGALIGELDAAARSRVVARRDDVTRPVGPTPFARWTFDDGTARDSVGELHGTLHEGARIAGGDLLVDGQKAFMRTVPIPRDFREKTLEAWVRLPTLDQGGGGVVTLEDSRGGVFDSIVFGERQPRKWMAGSTGFQRTRDLDGAEETATDEAIHVAITYDGDGRIAVYRNGEPYAPPYTPSSGLQTYRAGDARVVLGMRHTGGGRAFLAGAIEEASLHDRALTANEVAASCASRGLFVSREEALAALTDPERREREELSRRLASLRSGLGERPAEEKSYVGTRRQPAPTRRLERGDVRQAMEVVAPGALSAIDQPPGDLGLAPDAPEAERRRRLAAWIADQRNPLTARVMVNRVWHWHFGRGLVATPNDFGKSGEGATHPELIDWLAGRFIDDGWSVKRLSRRILTSAAYRRSSRFDESAAARDSENQLLWRFSPRRVEAEVARDAMLFASDALNLEMGGPGFRDFTVSTFGSSFYTIEDRDGPEYRRRAIYRMNVNSGKQPFLDALDCPDPAVKTPRRRATTTPTQALALMNNPFVQRQARRLAERALAESSGDLPAAVERAYRRTFGRDPTPREREASVAVAREHGLPTVCWALFNASEFLHVR